jgi:hypothetical protein
LSEFFKNKNDGHPAIHHFIAFWRSQIATAMHFCNTRNQSGFMHQPESLPGNRQLSAFKKKFNVRHSCGMEVDKCSG